MIKEFKSGYWYKWIGETKRQKNWASSGDMDFVLNGKWYQCNVGGSDVASFKNSDTQDRIWLWGRDAIQHFEESETRPFEMGDEVYCSDTSVEQAIKNKRKGIFVGESTVDTARFPYFVNLGTDVDEYSYIIHVDKANPLTKEITPSEAQEILEEHFGCKVKVTGKE